jgi:hypothetical protein
VEGDAPGAELGELVHGVDRVDGLAGRAAERIAAGVADSPEAEREPVLGPGSEHVLCDGHDGRV